MKKFLGILCKMTDQATVNAAVLEKFERDFEAEGDLIKRRLAELAADLKLIRVALVGTEDDGGDGPMFVTLMIEPVPHADAIKGYLKIAEAPNGNNHVN
jgi:hypothetical protein